MSQPLILNAIKFICLLLFRQKIHYWNAHNVAVIPPLAGTLFPFEIFSLVGYGYEEG
jgi:hypothetical protein